MIFTDNRELIVVRRNDYLAAIRDDLSDVQHDISLYDDSLKNGEATIDLCKNNRSMKKFKRVVKLEIRILKWKYKMDLKYQKKLLKLLGKAEKYTPGSNAQF